MPERYREEIEEILEQAGDLPPPQPPRRSRPSIWALIGIYVRQSLGGRLLSVSPGRVMAAALVILLLALVFGRVGPGIGAPLALAALLLFIAGYAWMFLKPPKIEKRWRGQPVDDDAESWRRRR